MSKAKFTKGKWEARTDDHSGIKVAIVYLSDKGGFDLSGSPNCIENAHLIASAPKMYSKLQSIVDSGNLQGSVENEVLELLAEARGESV